MLVNLYFSAKYSDKSHAYGYVLVSSRVCVIICIFIYIYINFLFVVEGKGRASNTKEVCKVVLRSRLLYVGALTL